MNSITVEEIYSDTRYGLGLRLVAGKAGLSRKVAAARIQKPGLAFAGYTRLLHSDRVQVLGYSEISYLSSLPESRQREAVRTVLSYKLCCIVVTRGQPIPLALIEAAEETGSPLFSTDLLSSVFISRVGEFLQDRLAETTSLHGVLVDVLGVGVLLIGKSGVGKSECALDLILRGHRLVADDVVEVRKRGPSLLLGRGVELIKHHVEIRGLGVINVKDMFGVAAVSDEKSVDMVIELVEWEEEEYDRLGLEEKCYSLLGIELPLVKMPIRPSRNIATVVEIAARNFLLKREGSFSALQFEEKVKAAILGQGGDRNVG